MVHHNDVGEFEKGVEGENVVHRVLRMAGQHSDDDCLSGVEPKDLLWEDSGVGAAQDEDLGRVQFESLHLREGWQRAVGRGMLFVPLDELGDCDGSHGYDGFCDFTGRNCWT